MDPPSKNDEIPHNGPAEASANAPDDIQPSRAENEPRVVVEKKAENELPLPEEISTALYTLDTQIAAAADARTPVADDEEEDVYSDDRIIAKSSAPDESLLLDARTPVADDDEEDLYSDDRIIIKSRASEGSLPDAHFSVADDENEDLYSDDRIIVKSSASEEYVSPDAANFVADTDEDDLYANNRIVVESSASEGSQTPRNTPSPSPERVIESMAPRNPRPADPSWRKSAKQSRPKFTTRLREALFVRNAD